MLATGKRGAQVAFLKAEPRAARLEVLRTRNSYLETTVRSHASCERATLSVAAGPPATSPRIRRAQRRQYRCADDCRRDQTVPNLSHAITSSLLPKQSHITVYT